MKLAGVNSRETPLSITRKGFCYSPNILIKKDIYQVNLFKLQELNLYKDNKMKIIPGKKVWTDKPSKDCL